VTDIEQTRHNNSTRIPFLNHMDLKLGTTSALRGYHDFPQHKPFNWPVVEKSKCFSFLEKHRDNPALWWWACGSALASINVVTLRLTRLVLGWVTVSE